MSMPPTIEMFFQKLLNSPMRSGPVTVQKLWNRNAASSVNTAIASAAQRAFHPTASRMPPPSSTRIVSAVSTCGMGSPLLAMYPAVPSKPPIFANPEMMKISASRMRPTSAVPSYWRVIAVVVVIAIAQLPVSSFIEFEWSWKVEHEQLGLEHSATPLRDRDRAFLLD